MLEVTMQCKQQCTKQLKQLKHGNKKTWSNSTINITTKWPTWNCKYPCPNSYATATQSSGLENEDELYHVHKCNKQCSGPSEQRMWYNFKYICSKLDVVVILSQTHTYTCIHQNRDIANCNIAKNNSQIRNHVCDKLKQSIPSRSQW